MRRGKSMAGAGTGAGTGAGRGWGGAGVGTHSGGQNSVQGVMTTIDATEAGTAGRAFGVEVPRQHRPGINQGERRIKPIHGSPGVVVHVEDLAKHGLG